MADYEFNGMENTGQQSVEGDIIYRDYSSGKFYKKDYIGNQIECDQSGNLITRNNINANRRNNRSGAGIGYLFLFAILLMGAFKVLIWSKYHVPLLIIPFIALTVSVYMANEKGSNFLYKILFWLNRASNAVLGFALMSNLDDRFHILDLPDILRLAIPLIVGYFLLTLIQKLAWNLIDKKRFIKNDEDMSLI